MMDLKNLPIVPFLSDADRERCQRKVMQSIQADGAASRLAGVPKNKCPNFVDSDMTVDWLLGWRHQDEIIRKKRRPDGSIVVDA